MVSSVPQAEVKAYWWDSMGCLYLGKVVEINYEYY